ncbi:MAG TPA: TonB-dependent siderophore receptor [Hyphomicrobiaceae bacterium]|nr:TonB-dependent siderophore receptor [Hyphomicrobiaceae bacterium]
MSSVRVPGSLRSFAVAGGHDQAKAAAPKKDANRATLVTAALLTAASPLSMALAQSSLPPLSVETQAKKKPKAAPPAKGAVEAQPSSASGAPATDANPYADPNAPYKIDKSASGKFTEPLVNTPRTVSAVPQQVLDDTAVRSIRELARQVPGITLGFGEGGNAIGDRIYIRGFDARGDIYVDGIRDPGNASRETFAVEQIEIYKGPASTVGGRSTAGGALNIITKKPNEYENFYNLSQMFGTDQTLRTTIDVNQVFTPWLAVRGNLLFHDAEVAGRDFVEDQRWGGFVSTAIKPSQDFKVTLDYYRYRTDGIPDWGIPLNTTTHMPWTESGLPRENWYGNINRDFIKNSQDIVTATVEARLSENVTLTSRTRAGETVIDYIASGPGGVPETATTLNANNPNRFQDTTLIASQSDLTFKFDTGAWRHTLVAGVEMSREDIGRYSYVKADGTGGLSGATGISLFDPNPNRPFDPFKRYFSFDATIDTKAAYLLDAIQLSTQWYVNGGVRFDRFEREQVIGPPIANPTGPSTTASRDDNLFNWHVGVLFKPLPIASIYAAYGTAASPVGSELDANSPDYGGLSPASATIDPERSTSVEVGTKWELFNRRLLATAALFQTEKENARELGATLQSTGAYLVRGVELGAYGNLTDRWSVYGGVVLLDTEVTKSANPALEGRDIANIPLTQFSLLSKYKLTEKLTVGGQAIYSGEVYGGTLAVGDSTGGVFNRIPEHWRFDALAEYKFTDSFSAQVNVVNLTDEVYYDAFYRSATPFVFIAPGRAAYLTLNWKY